jgi:ParB family transcriptional regulator, chromosome partitioning protein
VTVHRPERPDALELVSETVEYKVHPAADLFPLLEGEDFDALAESIREHGLQRRIARDTEGRVLDGRNRLRACEVVGVEPDFTTYPGTDCVDFVMRENLLRRHLTSGQKAAIANDLMPLYEAEAKERMAQAPGQSRGTKSSAGADLPEQKGRARDQAAKAVGTSGRAVGQFKRVAQKAPKLAEKVRAGELPLDAAEKQVRKPHLSEGTGDEEWYTPPAIARAARKVLGGIDLDPASCRLANEVVGASRIWTAEDDGLAREWKGTIFMNPPYTKGVIDRFCTKLIHHFRDIGDVTKAIVLVSNSTETEWFQSLAYGGQAICFPNERVSFWRPDKAASKSPIRGHAIFYFGTEPDTFLDEFKGFGFTVLCGPLT